MKNHITPSRLYYCLGAPIHSVSEPLKLVPGVSTAQTGHYCENFVTQKLLATPEWGGAGQVRLGPRPHPDVRDQVHVRLPQA